MVPRAASISSAMRRPSGNRKYNQIAWLMISAGKRWPAYGERAGVAIPLGYLAHSATASPSARNLTVPFHQIDQNRTAPSCSTRQISTTCRRCCFPASRRSWTPARRHPARSAADGKERLFDLSTSSSNYRVECNHSCEQQEYARYSPLTARNRVRRHRQRLSKLHRHEVRRCYVIDKLERCKPSLVDWPR